MYNKILLNIPHSSLNNYNEGWSGKYKMFSIAKKWTDWHTELLFNPDDEDLNIISFAFPFSRFYCDVERLPNDPLEMFGQGIYYTNFNGFHREKDMTLYRKVLGIRYEWLYQMTQQIEENTLIIDCHSFPSSVNDVDICIGFNEDWSKPDDGTINLIADAFKKAGCTVGINEPYTNSITPTDSRKDYKSVMIEVNKKLYMNEDTLEVTTHNFDIVHKIINGLYLSLLKN